MDFGHVLTAMVTPFTSNGEIDYDKTTSLIEHLIAHGTDGLIVTGTTGESPTLSSEEKNTLLTHVIKIVNKRIPVIAGTGTNDTATSIAMTKKAEALGADAIMLVTPYYNKPSQRGLYEHFSHIAQATSLPIMLYNIPGRSAVRMTAKTIIRLSEIENIVSVKDACGDLEQAAEIIEQTDESFTLYSGDDSMTLPILSIGGTGVVSVASHIIGNELQYIIQSYMNGEIEKAAKKHRLLLPIMQELFKAPSPAPIKAALQMKGLSVGGVRLPLVGLSKEEEQSLKKIVSTL